MSRNILYTKHAEDMVKLRKIPKGLVDKALIDPDEILNQNETKINHKLVGDKLLRVVYKESGNSYIVITTYLTHKERYRTGELK
ncbi:MAG: DUF4258 domain-containing protein [Theionarchaea archaeon]|nr:DUF4258 domain-containing protein [Theionarchaea archaeon]